MTGINSESTSNYIEDNNTDTNSESNTYTEITEGKVNQKEENLRIELEELRKAYEQALSKNEELTGRVETLQDSLDSILEEISLKNQEPIAEKDEENEVQFVKPEEIEKEIEKSIKQETSLPINHISAIEEILVKEEARDLEGEIAEALRDYPLASREEILSEIEAMTDEEAAQVDIKELAQLSHERQRIEQEQLRVKLEDELRTQIQKELEGKISLPQSSGASSASKVHQSLSSPGTPYSHDVDWDEALQRAKVEHLGA